MRGDRRAGQPTPTPWRGRWPRGAASSSPTSGCSADGTAVKTVGAETFRLVRELVDDFVVVDTDEICAAIKDVFEDTRTILEPAGALAVAGAQGVRRRVTAAAARRWSRWRAART